MTRIKLELTAVDDLAAVHMMLMLANRMLNVYVQSAPLAPQYSVSDTDGSCVADVTREDNGIERGMEVTP